MKSEPNTMKRRLLLVQKLLYENTDEQHPLTTFEILDYLESQGIVTNRKTLKGDIDLMVDCGMDIITVQSKPNRYYWGARTFEKAELKLLVDAVSSSRFITQKKSRDISKKLLKLASVHDRDDLKRNIYATNRIKSRNESLLYTVDAVNKAITSKRKVSFQYYDYTAEKKKILRNGGEIYILSPYALFWNDDFYYVVGYSDKHDNVSTFRADRICHLEMVDEKAVKKPKVFSLDRYSRQIFEMYDGDTVRVKLECRNELMKYVIDRFDESVETEVATENTFYAYPEVALSPNFYSWLFKFAGEIRLLAPERARNEYIAKAKAILEDRFHDDNEE